MWTEAPLQTVSQEKPPGLSDAASRSADTRDQWAAFDEIVADALDYVKRSSASTGAEVVGHLLPDVPQEIIFACGAHPFGIQGAGAQGDRASAVFPAFTCNHAMGALEMGMNGSLSFMKAIVIPYVCDTTRNLGHLWSGLVSSPKAIFLRLPKRLGFSGAAGYLQAEFSRLALALGRETGTAPTEERLHDAIVLFNRTRARLRLAYDTHRSNPDVLSMAKLRLLLMSAVAFPGKDLLNGLERASFAPGIVPESALYRIPLYIKGKVWDPPYLASLLDELGFVLAGDELVTGRRSIDPDASETGDPVAALVDRHLKMTPYTGFHAEPREAARAFLRRVASSGAKAVLFLNPKFCEAAAFDTPDLRGALEKNGIPSLVLETSAGGVSAAQIQVRLEAFREMISDELS
jgi:benzoyl-CoA reductase/2-hydroxyglutaryl-CoA dehydratase subunit BcrC/BadD/HgdB